MTQEEYKATDWHRGNCVRLSNGKEYKVSGVKKKVLVLKSEEYDTHFFADYRIIQERTSDYIDSEEQVKKPTPPARPKRFEDSKPVVEKHEEKIASSSPIKEDAKPIAEEVKTAAEEAKPKRKRVRIAAGTPRYEKASLFKNKK